MTGQSNNPSGAADIGAVPGAQSVAVATLDGADLALWVARAEKLTFVMRGEWPAFETDFDPETRCHEFSIDEWKCWLHFKPHEDWEQGGPLIEWHDIFFNRSNFDECGKVFAFIYTDDGSDVLAQQYGKTRLVAAMRALVASVYGATVPGAQP